MIKWMMIFLFVPLSFIAHSQELLLDINVDKQNRRNLLRTNSGPNLRHFWSRNVAYGFIVPLNNSDSLHLKENMASNWWSVGQRYKFKLNEVTSIGAGIQYAHSAWHIDQDNRGNLLTPGKRHDSQRLITNELLAGIFVRVNFGRRGNSIGRYLDLGCDGQYVFANRLTTTDDAEPSLNRGAKKVKASLANLDYIMPFQASAIVRIGFGRLAVFGRYRLTDMFHPSDNINGGKSLPELSGIVLGIELTSFRTSAGFSENENEE